MRKMRTFAGWFGLIAIAIAVVSVLPHSALSLGTGLQPVLLPMLAGGTVNKFPAFAENVYEKVHNMGSDALTYALTSVAPVATNSILGDLTQVSYTNMSARVPTISSSAQTSGTYKLILADLVLLMTGGASPSFRYVNLYNDT